MALPQVHKQAEWKEHGFIQGKMKLRRPVIQKPGKQFFIAYPAAVSNPP